MAHSTHPDIWLAAGVRTPFAKVDGALSKLDAIGLSVPVAQAMLQRAGGVVPDFAIWGSVVPNLTWSNIAREVLMDAGAPRSEGRLVGKGCGGTCRSRGLAAH